MSLTGVYCIEEKLQFESHRKDEQDDLKNFRVVDHYSPHSPHEWPRLRQRSPSVHQKVSPENKRRDPQTTAEPVNKRRDSDFKRTSSKRAPASNGEAGDDKPPFRFKLNDNIRKKLQQRTPIISGYTLEHYYRYGKPPFLNFGYQRNVRLTRY